MKGLVIGAVALWAGAAGAEELTRDMCVNQLQAVMAVRADTESILTDALSAMPASISAATEADAVIVIKAKKAVSENLDAFIFAMADACKALD